MHGQSDREDNLLVLTDVTVVDPAGPHHHRRCSIVIRNGLIEEISFSKVRAHTGRALFVEADAMVVTPGWVDTLLLAGNWLEHPAELPAQVARCAIKGGFTHVVVAPSLLLDLSEPSVVASLRELARHLPVEVLWWGQFFRRDRGLAPLLALAQVGVVGFASVAGTLPPDNFLLMQVARYASLLDKPLLLSTMVVHEVAHSFVHFCEEAEWWGLEGVVPALEEALVERFVRVGGNTPRLALGPLSFDSFSGVFAGGGRGDTPRQPPYVIVLPVHLSLSTQQLPRLADSRYAFLPPVREEEHRRALLALVGSENVVVASGHASVQVHERLCELDAVNPLGVGTLELTFPLVYSALVDAGVHPTEALERCVVSLAHNPRTLLGWQPLHIEEGAPATLTLVEPWRSWTLTAQRLTTTTAETLPWRGWRVRGRVRGIVRDGHLYGL